MSKTAPIVVNGRDSCTDPGGDLSLHLPFLLAGTAITLYDDCGFTCFTSVPQDLCNPTVQPAVSRCTCVPLTRYPAKCTHMGLYVPQCDTRRSWGRRPWVRLRRPFPELASAMLTSCEERREAGAGSLYM